jgi:hypothetical protein
VNDARLDDRCLHRARAFWRSRSARAFHEKHGDRRRVVGFRRERRRRPCARPANVVGTPTCTAAQSWPGSSRPPRSSCGSRESSGAIPTVRSQSLSLPGLTWLDRAMTRMGFKCEHQTTRTGISRSIAPQYALAAIYRSTARPSGGYASEPEGCGRAASFTRAGSTCPGPRIWNTLSPAASK